MSKLGELPTEIISLICSLLKQPAKYNCILVNREFHAAAIPELWRAPVLPNTTILKQLLKCLEHSTHQKGVYIRTLRLGYKVSMTDEELLRLICLVPNLDVLELRKADDITDKSVTRISQHCTQLRSFSIKGSSLTYRSAHYLSRCQQLTKLGFESCPNLSSVALLPFAELHIEFLDLSGCKWLNVVDTAYDLCSLQHLTHLNLVCCDIVTAEFINYLTNHNGNPYLTNLQELSITGGTVIDDNAIIPFIKTHLKIKGLFLLECAVTDKTLEAIAKYLFLLHNLDVSFCQGLTVKGVRNMIENCPELRLLGLKNCGITKSDFSEIPNVAYPVVSEETYPHINTLSYIELSYIRERSHSSQKETEPMESEDTEMEEIENGATHDESVSQSYTYIQQYLNAVDSHV